MTEQEGVRPVALVEEPRRGRSGLSLLSLLLFLMGLVFGLALSHRHHELKVDKLDQVGVCGANAATIGQAMERYRTVHGEYPVGQYDLVPEYLSALPVCPTAQRMTYRSAFGRFAGTNRAGELHYYIVECAGVNHSEAGFAPDFPAFDSTYGVMLERAE